MTWLGEICKLFWHSVENLRENMNLKSKFCKKKLANFEDFPPIFCPSNDFLPQGRGRILVKYSLVCLLYKQCIFPTIKPPLLHDEIKFTFCSVQSFVNYGEYSKHGCRQWPGSDPARLDKCPSVSSCQLPA